jgi:hypothetical protein
MILPIEDEITLITTLLSHPAGFDIDLSGGLCIRPVGCRFAVDWDVFCEEDIVGFISHEKVFNNLEEAARFFCEKRRAGKIGLDFQKKD